MKILDNLGPPHCAYIGISKLCCLPCGAVLALAGIASRGFHGKGYETGWEYPAWLNGPGRLQAFLGATAWPLYNALSDVSKRLFLSDLKVSFKTLGQAGCSTRDTNSRKAATVERLALSTTGS
jgi:hypothetical protein